MMSQKHSFQIAVLVSGGGTTLKNLIDHRSKGLLHAEIRLVVSSNPEAGGLDFAASAGIESAVFDHRTYSSAQAISEEIFDACRRADIDLVVMGGFLRKLVIPEDFMDRVVNIHPSLIPAYCGKGMYGMRVHAAVVEDRALLSGCTVHFVDNQYDHGPIIAQASLKVGEATPQALQRMVFEKECELYPAVINAIAKGEVTVVGDEVMVKESRTSAFD